MPTTTTPRCVRCGLTEPDHTFLAHSFRPRGAEKEGSAPSPGAGSISAATRGGVSVCTACTRVIRYTTVPVGWADEIDGLRCTVRSDGHWPCTDEQIQQEADDLIGLAQALEQAAKDTRKNAAALRAHVRGLGPGEVGLLPTFGYSYANTTLSNLRAEWDKE